MAQDSTIRYSKKGVSKVANDLKKSLSTNNEEQTAKQYEALANELVNKGDYAKAEDYMKKALEIYTRLDKKTEIATVSRGLAKIQEEQNKIIPAIQNYQSAGNVTKDKSLEKINLNDANRLLNNNNPKAQVDYSQSNIAIFEKEGKKEEAADAYQQLAKSQLLQNKSTDAVASYKKAIEKSDNNRDIADISTKIVKVFVENNEISKAIKISEEVMENARVHKDTVLQINQAGELASLYEQNHEIVKAGTLLEEAYYLAFGSGNTSQTTACLIALEKYYKAQNNISAALTHYEDFLNNLDSLIKADSTLVDVKLFGETEGRIKDLERERRLQSELISKKNTLNYFLIGSMIAMLLLLAFIVRSLNAIKVKNKKIALQSLRREMNPHFIFNSLNSVNQYIAENNEIEANKYLTSYSGLMRNVMEHSHKDFVPLTVEVEQLKKYLDLEHLRFGDKFDYQLDIDEALDTDAVMIPNMLIQPHLENAIWHGLRYKATKGMLRLSFTKQDKGIQVLITDDGIGLAESRKLKTVNQKAYQSRGIKNTTERISLLNDIYRMNITLTMEEITSGGTRVILHLPLLDKK
jgi:ribosomal protein L11 methylase PrmA